MKELTDEPADAPLDELIAFCLEAERLGVAVDRPALLARHPDLAGDLAEFFEGHAALRRAAGPLLVGEAPVATDPNHAPTVAGDFTVGPHDPPDVGCGRLGRYRLLRELGRGGMGVVYEAWQEGVNRPAAVKVISSGPFASPDELRRFRTEAEAAANLSHPGLVPIYEVDVCDGRPFYSMELVPGESLADLARSGPLAAVRAAEIVAAVADAVDYAHGRGILHRDLKPANVLIDAAGRPRVTDFGLAKRFGEEWASGAERDSSPSASSRRASTSPDPLTTTGAVLGTPGYMSPEQAAGRREIGPAADVYGLGAILYFLLTGRPPFRAATAIETIGLVLEAKPTPPRAINPEVPPDVETALLKCLEKDPGDRYRTAADFAADLRRFLAGEPIAAVGLSLWGRLTRAVGQSRNTSQFRHWGRSIVAFGVVVFAAHAAMHLLDRAGVSAWWSFLPPRLAMFAGLAAVLNWSRRGSLLPRDGVERLVWIVWTGYFLAFAAAGAATAVSGRPHTSVYPFAAALSGMGFFTLGCHVWGACYLVGVAFFLAAPLLALVPEWSVFGFGVLWGLSLLALGLRYDRLNRTLPTEE